MKLWLKLALLCLPLASIGWLTLRHVESHAPVREGAAAEFWWMACGVEVGGRKASGFLGGTYPSRDNLGIYYFQGYHGQSIHTVSLVELAPLLPDVAEQLRSRRDAGELTDHLQQALDATGELEADPKDVRELLSAIRNFRLAELRRNAPEFYRDVLASELSFDERWKRAGNYRATVLFEFAWLSGWVVFISIPWLSRAGAFGWSIALSLAPPLLFLPYFLGYVPYVFTSAFPAGGVIYPYTLIWFRGLPWFPVDTWIMQTLPQPLEQLTQAPDLLLSLSDTGRAGPVSICLLGMVLGCAVYALAKPLGHLARGGWDLFTLQPRTRKGASKIR